MAECPMQERSSSWAARGRSCDGTTPFTRPRRSASSASTVRVVQTNSLVLAGPTRRAKWCIPPEIGDEPIAGFEHSEPNVPGGHPEIARQRELEPSPKRVRLDGGDRGF